jgi:hypothetical protein
LCCTHLQFCFSTLSIFKQGNISDGWGISPQKTGFRPTIVSLGFVVDKMLQWQAFCDHFSLTQQFDAPAIICIHLSAIILDGEVPTGFLNQKPVVYLPSGTSLLWLCHVKPQRFSTRFTPGAFQPLQPRNN